MTITINRKFLIGVLAVGILVLGGLLLSSAWLKASQAAPAMPEQVATDFARAYYTVDYRDQQAWLSRLQPLMTEAGFTLVKTQFAPAVWKTVTPAKFTNTLDQIEVRASGLAAEGESQVPTPRAWQIQRLQISLAPEARWPGMTTDTTQLNVLLERPQAGGEWKVVTTLSDQSVELFKQRGASQ
ncbi:MAG: hypothetical protein KA764_12340 [Anaerolineales bacterium]|nr:hypothetical protein [Anaerolineales bacterium]